MLIAISPAKTLDYETPPVTKTHTKPRFLKQSKALIDNLRNYSALDLAELMNLSIKLSELNFDRYHDWKTPFNMKNAKQAALAMKGDVYTGLDAETLDESGFEFAQRHLRILSGLYGVLKPLDLMQPYRLEMGTKLPNEQGKDLYAFWGEQITQSINKDLKAQGDDILVNLASNEYFKSIKPKLVKGRIITPQFKERKNGSYRMIGVFAKKARGLMSRYIIDNQLSDPEDIKGFDVDGYRFNKKLSKDDQWVFTRS
ncbi:MAG: peroxide stress protein YaaA [Candidatus Thiodiazotropha sp. (ex Ctena orbiculata)]|nr:peroxide stress protein YaaA [Candidatus Thiodiazotropha taylori]